ncbi:MAG: translesion DNA synthesis-associated protein ImuA [Proteobacteria bacterium]|nr:translesion DNA synthesis-associated protein ImuA [Pseudomonadota bacterium]
MSVALSLGEILARPDVWRGDRLASAALPAVSSGFALLDAELPGEGWPRGTLTEILADGAGVGECSLLMPALIRMREEGRWSLLVGPPHLPHGPAWASWGIDLARLAVVSPIRPRDALWAAEQALSSGALGTVVYWAPHIDARQVRRLQVACAGSNTLAFLLRPHAAGSEASAAALRLSLSAGTNGRLDIKLLKRRGPPCNRTLSLALPRPVKSRKQHASAATLARPPFAAPPARSLRPVILA